MNITDILKPLTKEQMQTLSKSDLIHLLLGEQDIRQQLEAFNQVLEEEKMRIEGIYVRIKNKVYGKSSEKCLPPKKDRKKQGEKKKPNDRTLLPSERYPEAMIIEQEVELETLPICRCCGQELSDSGMIDTAEVLSVIPKQYIIKRQHYHKYRCSHCHSDIQVAPTLPRIKSGSTYDDDITVDVSLSKYCDLIPIERYAQMAKRMGLEGLPPHSLIELTHYLSDFITPVYDLIRKAVMESELIHADETPHRMLEGDQKSNWYLWGFSGLYDCYFECHDTRSGDIALEILKKSKARYLMSDVYAGYGKAVRLCNEHREANGLPLLINISCNAHARRYFKESENDYPDLKFFVESYKNIYKSEEEMKSISEPEEGEKIRKEQRSVFEKMRAYGQELTGSYSNKSGIMKSINYFLNNYDSLTLFTSVPELPIDNNHEERLLRNHVVGRKTWYGTHSKRGAETSAKLFTIVESCKLNKVNPRSYLKTLIKEIHQNQPIFTPREFSKMMMT